MKQKIAWIATALVAGFCIAPFVFSPGAADDDLERVLMQTPSSLTSDNLPQASEDFANSAFASQAYEQSSASAPSSLASSASNSLGFALGSMEPEFEILADGSKVVHNAKVEIPKGEGYEVTISANGQGLLVELGLFELDAQGEVVLNDDGSSKRQMLRRGMLVHQGDILGKQQDDELTQEKIVAMQELLVARKEAEKTLEVEVAEAAARVAQASYQRANALNKEMPGSVSPEEVQEKYYDWLRATKSIEKAKYDLEVNQEKVKVSEARVTATDVQIRNRKFRSPIDGVIDDVYQNEGQWLREGDEVLRILRLDKVQVTGSVNAQTCVPEMIDGKDVRVTVERPGYEKQELPGKIIYVRQVVESGHYYFYAEVANAKTTDGYWILNPGALVTITIL
ncbi:MAG: HlyD family efflux transporter periplasmic adaptor subunit [Planctomycetia bacterium]|nr:HlyD family efflux transporter periplasmic adaptor subunit [Planctomycetia bacterium]